MRVAAGHASRRRTKEVKKRVTRRKRWKSSTLRRLMCRPGSSSLRITAMSTWQPLVKIIVSL